MRNKIHSILALSTLLIICPSHSSSQEEYKEWWGKMQEEYISVCHNLGLSGADEKEKQYNHRHWIGIKDQMKGLILGKPPKRLLQQSAISGQMVRTGIRETQQYEICYLKDCITQKTKGLLDQFSDTTFSNLARECHDFDCSVSTLGYLFSAAKSLEQFEDQDISTIVELGSGYGGLARVFKSILPDATLFLIDIPEFLAIQYLFLHMTLPHVQIIMHSSIPESFDRKAIHLIPSCLVDDLHIKTDLFISTFALSETAIPLQEAVINKRFFDSNVCYISGQLSGWKEFNFVDQSLIFNGMRSQFKKTHCQPYHTILNGLYSYEIIGVN
jgi:putative sugar O-methyltransferase